MLKIIKHHLNKKVFISKFFSSNIIKLTKFADSIEEVTIKEYLKKEGDFVYLDEEFLIVESSKGTQSLRATAEGKLIKILAEVNSDAVIGQDLIEINTDAEKPTKKEEPIKSENIEAKDEPKKVTDSPTPTKEEPKKTENVKKKDEPVDKNKNSPTQNYERKEDRVKLSRLRRTVADRLKESQNVNAHVTTFQELDMSEIMQIRKKYGEEFLKQNKVKLGIMSFFIKACAIALNERPVVNAVIDDKEIIYRNYVDISIAVSGPNGLIVPVLRDLQNKSLKNIELEMNKLANKAKTGDIAIEDMQGGTFTISNGGVFGSMLSVPIINPPQSAVLGMHNIVDRPVVKNGKVEVAPIMYLALSYDHRLLDGREGAGFLKRVRDLLQDPYKMLLDDN